MNNIYQHHEIEQPIYEKPKFKANARYETGFIKYMTIEQFQKIEQAFDTMVFSPSMRMCLKVLARSGLRVGDCVSLQRSNFNTNFSVITKQMQKTKKFVTVPLPLELAAELKKYWYKYKHRMKSGFMFFSGYSNNNNPNSEHLNKSSVELKLSEICDKLGYNQRYYTRKDGTALRIISPHTFRHFFIHVVAKQCGLRVAQQLVGHVNINQTAKYDAALQMVNNPHDVMKQAFTFKNESKPANTTIPGQ